MRLTHVGEFGLIDRIRQIVGQTPETVVVGMGDDGAVLRSQPGWNTVLTTDALVEGVHFDLSYTPVESLGWKALAINLSDVAAMGGIPRYAVVSLALPSTWTVEDVALLYEGMGRCGRKYGCAVVGGDTVRSRDGCFVSVTVFGEVEEGCAVGRDGAHEGDYLCVTGEMGGARVGLEVLRSGEDERRFRDAVSRFLEPAVRLQEARRLVRELGVSSMIDVSDGLASEVGHLCKQSDLGCLLWEEKVPVAEDAVRWNRQEGTAFSAYALESGEEYELLFTVDKSRYDAWRVGTKNSGRVEVTVVGQMTRKEDGIRVVREGEVFPLLPAGWDHFRG